MKIITIMLSTHLFVPNFKRHTFNTIKNSSVNLLKKIYTMSSISKIDVLESPVKSKNDKKLYRVIRLENGLKACLISDVEHINDIDLLGSIGDKSKDISSSEEESEEDNVMETSLVEDGSNSDDGSRKTARKTEEKLAAASLCIRVGSFNDPKYIPGMAHFLEHMVFMGSEKYPQENDFDSFVKKRGGSDNASTDCETTTFYFECQECYLEETLDKFAQFFVSPLLKRDSMQREREAIESEFQMALPSDTERREQLLLNLAYSDHPVNTFTWGNLVTLKDNVTDDQLHEEVHLFRKRHYSAHRMTLAVQARLPMEKLEKFVIDNFSSIPSNNLAVFDSGPPATEVFDSQYFNRLYYIKPVTDICKIHLIWSLPSLLDKYKSKPHQYVSWLLGHEGKGSLLSYLRKKVWALSIITGNNETGIEHNTMYALFTVTIVLTKKGLENLAEVICAIFSYIKLIRDSGPQEHIFKEIQSISNTAFNFQEEQAAADYVEELSESMHYYPPKDYITGSELYFEYDPESIKTVTNHLKETNCCIMVESSENPKKIVYDKTEKWFKTKYSDKAIPEEWIAMWKNVEVYSDIALPEPNVFIATKFNIINHGNVPQYPEKICGNDLIEVWYKPDNKFKMPVAYIYLTFISPYSVSTPENCAMLDLYVHLLEQQLVESIYPARMAEYGHIIMRTEKGLTVKIYGYDEKLPLFLRLILDSFSTFSSTLDVEMFEAIKEKLKKSYYNTFRRPNKLAMDIRLSILTQTHWTAVNKYQAVSEVNFDMMKVFGDYFLKHVYIQSLFQGNITKDTSLTLVNEIIDILKCEPLLFNDIPQVRTNQLPLGEYCCRVHSFNKTDPNSVVINYYQSDCTTVRNLVLVELLMMIIEEPLFDILRTKEQLGYNVYNSLRDTFGVLGFSITVNSQADKHSTQFVDERIEAFIKEMIKQLKKMPNSEITDVREDLIKLKKVADIYLKEEIDRNWAEIVEQEYMFDRLECEIACLQNIKPREVREWLDNHSLHGSKNTFRKLTIQVVGSKNIETGNSETDTQSIKGKTNVGNVKYPDWNVPSSEFLIRPVAESSNSVQSADYFITNIEKFKQKLFVYPVNKLNKN